MRSRSGFWNSAGPASGLGGWIWIAVPNAGSFFARALQWRWHSADLPVHLQRFHLRSLRRALERTSFRLEDTHTESENSLPASARAYLRRFGVPSRISGPLLGTLFSNTGVIGRRMDAAGHGEAILVTAHPAG